MSPTRQLLALTVFIGICLGAAGLGSVLTMPALRSWYAALQKPRWTPPNWIFAPVWTTLYVTMALAAWLVWRQKEVCPTMLPLTLFFIQLALNVLWSALFFRLHLPGAAFLELAVLWTFILSTAIAFWRVSEAAGWLMAPYLAWVTFAATLNAAVWRMNS